MEKDVMLHYLLNKKVKIYQPDDLYHASTDAVWVAAAVRDVKEDEKILDVGSGTGAIALCLSYRFKEMRPQITGVELQEELVKAANESVNINGFDKVLFEQVDILKSKYKPCFFDHVITNPPYLINDMSSPNKSKAMAHNFDEISFKKWLDFCLRSLKPKGHFYMINRVEALGDILTYLHGKLGKTEIIPIFSKPNDGEAKRIIVCGQKSSKAPLVLHAALCVHNEDGTHSLVANQVLRDGKSIYRLS